MLGYPQNSDIVEPKRLRKSGQFRQLARQWSFIAKAMFAMYGTPNVKVGPT